MKPLLTLLLNLIFLFQKLLLLKLLLQIQWKTNEMYNASL